jgi:hypothetical protein
MKFTPDSVTIAGTPVDIFAQPTKREGILISIGFKIFELVNLTEAEGKRCVIYSAGEYLTEVFGAHFHKDAALGTVVARENDLKENDEVIALIQEFYLD